MMSNAAKKILTF